MKTLFLAATLATSFIVAGAQAADIKVLSPGAVKEIATELLPQFEKSSGNKVTITWAGTEKIKARIAAGETYDLVIVSASVVDTFIKAGKLQSGTRVDLVRSGAGVAVKAGAPKPDISSGDKVKQAMLAAKAIAYSTGPSGVYINALIEKFGIAEQMKTKTIRTPPGMRVSEVLVKGEADLAFQQTSELIHEKGIDFVGPLPPDIQHVTVFSSGIHAAAKQPDAAKALQRFLTSAAALPVVKKNGMEPAAN